MYVNESINFLLKSARLLCRELMASYNKKKVWRIYLVNWQNNYIGCGILFSEKPEKI